MAARDIYLIRHAQSEWNAAGRWQGMADPELSDLGRQQAQELADQFTRDDVTHLSCSTLRRARDTAAPLARTLGLPAREDPDLCELDVGSWEGKTRAEIAVENPGALDAFFQGKQGWTGGESYADHERRCDRAAQRLRLLPDESVAVVVTHGGTLRALVLALLDLPHEHRWKFSGIGHTAITQLSRGEHGYRLVAFNTQLGNASLADASDLQASSSV